MESPYSESSKKAQQAYPTFHPLFYWFSINLSRPSPSVFYAHKLIDNPEVFHIFQFKRRIFSILSFDEYLVYALESTLQFCICYLVVLQGHKGFKPTRCLKFPYNQKTKKNLFNFQGLFRHSSLYGLWFLLGSIHI